MKFTDGYFKKGDLVKLKSGGGVEMYVDGYKQPDDLSFLTKTPYQRNETMVTCNWMSSMRKVETQEFPNNALELIERS